MRACLLVCFGRMNIFGGFESGGGREGFDLVVSSEVGGETAGFEALVRGMFANMRSFCMLYPSPYDIHGILFVVLYHHTVLSTFTVL